MELFDLVKNFRECIDKAKDYGDFKNLCPFDKFPNECCGHVSDLLANYLKDNGYGNVKIINGSCFNEYKRSHVWILLNDSIVIDITLDQFQNEFVDISDDLVPVYIGEENRLHKMYSKNRFCEKITNVKEKEFDMFGCIESCYQSRLVDLYNIINKYL